jgi:hypothetical protein
VKFSFVSLLLSLLGDSSFEVQSQFVSVKAGEGRVRKEKFGFVLFLVSLLGDSSFEVQSHMKAVKAESGKTGLH